MRSGSMIRSGSGVVNGSGVVGSGLVISGSWVVRSRVGFVSWGRLVVNGSGGRLVNRLGSGFVCGSRGGFVSGSRVSSRLVFRVGSFTFISHISDIAIGASTVGNNLDTTVGKVNTVFSSGIVVITALLLAENGSITGIVDTIFIVIHWGKDRFGSGGVPRGLCGGHGTGDSQKAGGNSELEWQNLQKIDTFKKKNSFKLRLKNVHDSKESFYVIF